MKRSSSIFATGILLFLIIYTMKLQAQESQKIQDTTLYTGKLEINVGFMFGGSAGNTDSFLESGMRQSGLNATVQGFFGTTNYPISYEEGGVYTISSRLFYKVNRGIALEFGKSAETKGVGAGFLQYSDDVNPAQQFYRLESTMNVHHIVIGYTFRSPSKRAEVVVGPALLLQTLSTEASWYQVQHIQKRTTPALFFAGRLHLLSKRWIYLGLETSIKWGFRAKFEEVSLEVGDEAIRYDPGSYSPFIFNVGLTAGFRMNFDRE